MDTNDSQAIQIPDDMRTFIIGIIEDSGMTDLDNDLREEMIKEIFIRLDKYIASVIVEKMPAEDVEVFIKMNEERKSQDEIQKFLIEKLPDAQQVMTQALTDFRDLYLGKVAVAGSAPSADQPESDKNFN